MRIVADMNRGLLAALEQIREQAQIAEAQLTSGRRVQSPSDDPAAAAAFVRNRAEFGATDQFSRNISDLRATLQTQDAALNSAVQVMTRAISLGVQGGTGTASVQGRQALAQEVRSLHTQLADLANTSVNGIYLFAGSAVTTRPFVLDAAAPAGVRYDANANGTTVEIAEGQNISLQLPGNRIFSAPGADAFQSLQNLAAALENAGDIAGATSDVKKAFDNMNLQRSGIGSSLARLDQASQSLDGKKLLLARQENDLVGADLAVAATNLTQTQTALAAALQAGSKISQLSLMDFLR